MAKTVLQSLIQTINEQIDQHRKKMDSSRFSGVKMHYSNKIEDCRKLIKHIESLLPAEKQQMQYSYSHGWYMGDTDRDEDFETFFSQFTQEK